MQTFGQKCFSIEDIKLWKPGKKVMSMFVTNEFYDVIESVMIASHSWRIFMALKRLA